MCLRIILQAVNTIELGIRAETSLSSLLRRHGLQDGLDGKLQYKSFLAYQIKNVLHFWDSLRVAEIKKKKHFGHIMQIALLCIYKVLQFIKIHIKLTEQIQSSYFYRWEN